MRRFLAALALIAVGSAGPLRAWCELHCAADDAHTGEVVLSHCHEDSSESNGPAFTSTEACGDHDAAPALTAAATSRVTSETVLQALPVELFGGLTRIVQQHAASFAVDTSPPILTKTTVLRV